MSCLLLQCDDASERQEFAEGLEITDSSHVFIPINNASELTLNASTHWSLMYVDVYRRVAVHLDSMHPSNSAAAQATARVVAEMLGIDVAEDIDIDMTQCNEHSKLHVFSAGMQVPQQENGYDCGVYTCLFAKHLLTHITGSCAYPGAFKLEEFESPLYAEIRMTVTPNACNDFRAEMWKCLDSLLK